MVREIVKVDIDYGNMFIKSSEALITYKSTCHSQNELHIINDINGFLKMEGKL